MQGWSIGGGKERGGGKRERWIEEESEDPE